MQTPTSNEPGEQAWAEQFYASLQAERERVQEFLETEQARLQRAEAILKRGIAELDENSQRSPTNGNRTPLNNLDWEAEKRRLLASLESEIDEGDEQREAERVKINELLKTTDKLVAEKDREIEDLKQQIGEAVNKLEEANPATELIDADAIVQQEREKLMLLQEEWQDKLRQAEIDLSVERANLARQRAELDEQMRTAGINPSESPDSDETERSDRGRWLAKLGLSEKDRVRRRKR